MIRSHTLWPSRSPSCISSFGAHGRLDRSVGFPSGSPEQPKQRKRGDAGAALVRDNGKTEVGDTMEVKPQIFALERCPLRAERILLNQNLPVGAAAVSGDLDPNFLGSRPLSFFRLERQPRDRLGLIELDLQLLREVSTTAEPTRSTATLARVE
jgi:hypothetical protein